MEHSAQLHPKQFAQFERSNTKFIQGQYFARLTSRSADCKIIQSIDLPIKLGKNRELKES